MKSAEAASEIPVMDGRNLNCALKTMQEAGFKNIKHLCLDDLGFKKGSTQVNHDATIYNQGDEPLRILKVKSG